MFNLKKLINTNVASLEPLITPDELQDLMPVSEEILNHILQSRLVVQNILDGKDERKFIVVGPCSIHDPKAAREYAKKLKDLSDKVAEKLFIIMRVYFEKPRTTVGWKGLINDPDLDDSFNIEKGLKVARQLLIDFNKMGLPCATEALDPISPQYLSELITWSAIGARTTESQTHREMSSGLSMPVGFKNGTDGSIEVAVNALKSVSHPHNFLGINSEGLICKVETRGNQYGHVVLRGGGGKPNYDRASIQDCAKILQNNNLPKNIVIDCSHENSNKDHTKQPAVFEDGISQIKDGNKAIVGFMIESFLKAGNQKLSGSVNDLEYGVSITDKCVDWETTEKMILEAYGKL